LRRLLPLLALPLVSCIESRLDVEILTQIHANGTCTRRIEYRLEQVDPEKSNARVAIEPEDDPLRLYRFPAGEPWLRTEETDVGHRVVVVEALLPSPQDVDGDYFRARSPKTPPARNVVSAFVDPEAAVYEYQEVFRDPASPLAAARALSRAAVKQEDAFAQRFKAEIGSTPGATPTSAAPTGSSWPSRSPVKSERSPSARSSDHASGGSWTRSTTASTAGRRRSSHGSRSRPPTGTRTPSTRR
jgi:hypothetical protein